MNGFRFYDTVHVFNGLYVFIYFWYFGKAKLTAENLKEPVGPTLKSQHMFQSNKQIEL